MMNHLSDFLGAFYPFEHEPIHIRAFKAKGDKGSPLTAPMKRELTRDQLSHDKCIQDDLKRLNENRGLYFVVNSGGNADSDIFRFNAFFAECDNLSIADQHALFDSARLKPSIRVETLKSVHGFWLIEGDCSKLEWREVQTRLIACLNSDPSIKNPSRVMRLPFFNHVSLADDGSYQYKSVELVYFEPKQRFTVADMLQAFPAPTNTNATNKASPSKSTFKAEAGVYETWDALWAEWSRRLMQHPSAKENRSGNWDCSGICHDGKGNTGLVYFPDKNRGHCNKGCDEKTILQAFGLPEKPSGIKPSPIERPTPDYLLKPLRGLTKDSKPSEIDAALRHFAKRISGCDSLGKEVARHGAIQMLKECGFSSPARLVDSVLPRKSLDEGEKDSKSLILRKPEPWPDPVNGTQLLDELTQTLSRFLSARDGILETVALWILYSYVFDAFDISPILAIISPEKRCGKTTLMALLDVLVSKPLPVSHITSAALFRTIEKYHPTVLIDEADTFLTGNEELRGIINSGHTRQTACVIRTVYGVPQSQHQNLAKLRWKLMSFSYAFCQ